MSQKRKNKVQPEKTAAAIFSRRDWILGLILVAAVILAYLPIWHAGFIWDDDFYVTNNSTLRDFNGLKQIWFDPQATPQYYPLIYTSFWLEYHAWKLDPMGYHIVNVLLHALGAILLWRVLKRFGLPCAWLAAAVFALHPVNVESVAWITERKNVLSAVFFFAAALAYFNFADGAENKKRRWWWLALMLFICALLSKTVACSLPVALLLARWWKKKRIEKNDVLPTIPFFVVGLLFGLQTAWLEKNHVGASGSEWSFSFVERCLIAGRALWFYAGKLVWPESLTFIYPRWQIDSHVWWQWLFPVAALAVAATLWFVRKRIGYGPLVAVLFFAATLFPALGFLNVFPMRYSFVADHFQYLAEIGLIVLITTGFIAALEFFKAEKLFLKPMLCGLLLSTLGILTWRQCAMYVNLETLWRTTLQRNPDCWMAHENLGNLLADNGKTEEAIPHLQRFLQLRPDDANAYYDLGNALFQRGDTDEAISYFQQSLQIEPDFVGAHNNLGNALLRKGSLDEAIAQFQKALQLKPDYGEARVDLGNALFQAGKIDEAIVQYRRALQINPNLVAACYNLGDALLQKGNTDEAIASYQQALKIKPDSAEIQNKLGQALFRKGDADQAAAHFYQALAINPDYIQAHVNLGNALHQTGNTNEAIAQYQKALELARAAGRQDIVERLNTFLSAQEK